MRMDTAQKSTENMAYVRWLISEKQPEFAESLELAASLTELVIRASVTASRNAA
jgi:hypothetical protein